MTFDRPFCLLSLVPWILPSPLSRYLLWIRMNKVWFSQSIPTSFCQSCPKLSRPNEATMPLIAACMQGVTVKGANARISRYMFATVFNVATTVWAHIFCLKSSSSCASKFLHALVISCVIINMVKYAISYDLYICYTHLCSWCVIDVYVVSMWFQCILPNSRRIITAEVKWALHASRISSRTSCRWATAMVISAEGYVAKVIEQEGR